MPYEQSAPAGGYESYACMQEDTYHKVTHSLNSYCGKQKRARLPCRKSVTRLCEVAAQSGSLTACLSCIGNKPGAFYYAYAATAVRRALKSLK